MKIKKIFKGAIWPSSGREIQSHFNKAPILLFASVLSLALACSSSNPNPAGGLASQKTNGRLLVSSETGTSVQIIDLQQSIVEAAPKSFDHSHRLVASPGGQFAFVVQASGNRVDLLKMGTSTAVSTESTTTSGDGHNHKPRYHTGTEAAAVTTTASTSNSSSSSVDAVDYSITGEGLKSVVARGQWIAIQFKDKVVALSEENLESKSNSITESIVKEFTSPFPGIAIDEEHIALGANVFNLSSGGNVFQSSANLSASFLVGANILSATRASEGIAIYGTDQGVWLVHFHSEPNRSHDSLIAYPSANESQIFLAEAHDHEGEEHHEGEDLHEEVMAHLAASTWASRDGLEHCFAHLSHAEHSAGVYLFEAGHSEDRWTYLADTSSANVRPVAMELAKFEEENSEGEHLDQFRLLILMSDGSLRIHDGADEGTFITSIPAVVSPITDFHSGEGNYPGLAAGLGKVYIGDPTKKLVTQMDLRTHHIDFTWQVTQAPNQLLFLGESTLAEETAAHTH
jgi:hypothetical protein